MMDKNKKENENINVELTGMGLYGTTSNTEIAGYKRHNVTRTDIFLPK